MRQVIPSGTVDALNNSATEYMSLRLNRPRTWVSTESSRQQVIPANGKFSRLMVEVRTAPGASASWTFTLMVNGVATSLTATITGAGIKEAADFTNEVSVSTFDKVSLRQTSSNSPTVTAVNWSVVFEADDFKKQIVLGLGNGITLPPGGAATSANYIGGGYSYSGFPVGIRPRAQAFAINGTLTDLCFQIDTAPGAGTSRQVDCLSSNVTLSNSQTQGQDTSTQNSISAGYFTYTTHDSSFGAANTTGRYSCVYEPNDEDKAIIMGGSDNTTHTTTTEYNFINSSGHGWTTSEISRKVLMQCGVMTRLYVVASAPTTGVLTVMKNGSATNLSVSLSSQSTANNVVDYVEFDDFDDCSIEWDPDAVLGTAVRLYWGTCFEQIFPPVSSLNKVGYGR